MNRKMKGHYRAACERLRLNGTSTDQDFQVRDNINLDKAIKNLKNKEKTKAIGEKLRVERDNKNV